MLVAVVLLLLLLLSFVRSFTHEHLFQVQGSIWQGAGAELLREIAPVEVQASEALELTKLFGTVVKGGTKNKRGGERVIEGRERECVCVCVCFLFVLMFYGVAMLARVSTQLCSILTHAPV